MMTRPPRIEVPGGYFHIAARGVDGASIYGDTGDRAAFFTLLHKTHARYDWVCRAYCLMGTHFHLLIRTLRPTLSRGMQALCGRYAESFNKRYGRKGHLFGCRFLSVSISSNDHLIAAHRYVERNPVAAGLCAEPTEWRWSSCRAILDLEPAFSFLDVAGALRTFDDRPGVARETYRRTITSPVALSGSEKYKLAEMDGV